MNKFNTSQNVSYEKNEQAINLSEEMHANKQDLYENISYKTLKRRSVVPDSRILFFMFGFCLGMALFYIFSFNNVDCFKMILNGKEVEQLKNYDENKELLLMYITELRINQLFVIFLCAFSLYKYILEYAVIGLFGVGFGILTFISLYQYGLIGLFFAFIMCFPHILFYLWAFYVIFNFNSQVDKNTYHKKIYCSSGLNYYVKKIKKILMVVVLYSLGILSETYINPELIKKIVIFL